MPVAPRATELLATAGDAAKEILDAIEAARRPRSTGRVGSKSNVGTRRRVGGSELHTARPMRVLLVEDEIDLAAEVVELLVSFGHDVRHVSNAPQALALIDSFEPEVVLLDIQLPVFDGNGIASDIRRHPHLRPRLVAFTAWVDHVEEGLFDAAVAKTSDVREMSRALVQAIEAAS